VRAPCARRRILYAEIIGCPNRRFSNVIRAEEQNPFPVHTEAVDAHNADAGTWAARRFLQQRQSALMPGPGGNQLRSRFDSVCSSWLRGRQNPDSFLRKSMENALLCSSSDEGHETMRSGGDGSVRDGGFRAAGSGAGSGTRDCSTGGSGGILPAGCRFDCPEDSFARSFGIWVGVGGAADAATTV
jgi:hypothetical protein